MCMSECANEINYDCGVASIEPVNNERINTGKKMSNTNRTKSIFKNVLSIRNERERDREFVYFYHFLNFQIQ